MSDDLHGPVDFILLEFPAEADTSEAAVALLDLVDSGVIRLWDLLVVRKGADGSVTALEVSADSPFGRFAGARSGLLNDDDIEEAASVMEPGTGAALIVYENAWAVPFIAGAMKAGGQLVASTRIPATTIMEALDALDALDA